MESQSAGNSLGKDAWRKLRRNRAAMLSLVWLIIICVLAAITPLLPLQTPDAVDMSLQYEEPTATPLWLQSFKLDIEAIEETPAEIVRLEEELVELEDNAAELEDQLDVIDLEDPAYQSAEEEYKTAYAKARRKHAEIEDVIQEPYRKRGFATLNPLSRTLVRMRYALFGEKSLNSICGRDELGRDVLSRVFWGARVSLVVGLVATFVSLVIGVTYGAVAGYFGGWVDDAMMRVVDVLYSVPFIFVVIFILTILGEESIARELAYWGIGRITVFFLVVGAIYWLTMSRVVRGQVISLKNEAFIEAARSLGAGHARIIFRHLLPNVFSVVLVYLTLTIPKVMLFEAFLSFLGLGVEPPNVSWGLLANEGIKVISPVKIYWWLILFPSLALGSTLLALNVLGDGLRDALDPKLRKE